jgi:lipid-binding SYLF domain-containing protein
MVKSNRFLIVLFSFVFLFTSADIQRLNAQDRDAEDQADRAREAATVLTEVMGIPEKGIPDALMERAQGIAVIPHVVKGALGIGGRYGKGLMSTRLDNGQWSAPTFVNISGGSFGLQIGVEASDLVLVFTDRKGVDAILKGKVKLGADASVAAGPVGRRAEVGTDVLLRSGVFSYSRSKGLFAGLALDGAVIEIDDSANAKVYGKGVTTDEILRGSVKPNAVVMPFMDAVQKHTGAKPASKPTQQ